MAEQERQKSAAQKVSDAERFRYIGFDVFPGQPKDLFSSSAEKTKLVEAVVAKRSKGEITREQCTLLEERLSARDRIVLAAACVLILLSLFTPWYSAYNEVVQETPASLSGESPAVAGISDTSGLATAGQAAGGTGEEMIHGMKSRKKVIREYSRLSGIGSLVSIGSVGSRVFTSGFILMLTGLILLFYTLACIIMPIYTLRGIFGAKGDPDQVALKLKKMLRRCWIPVVLFAAVTFFSFLGADYGFDAASLYDSLGNGYSVAIFLNALSWGMLVSLGGFILLAVKGVEI
ncbi:MAG TPA: hypothetical protein VN285_02365 [Candidatus Deferrimicrobium sp.]|nr:hypothetical protein [Candidatus Deferrimicrobium sp.]